MLALGIDPGTAITGYGLVRQAESGDLQALAHGVIQTMPDIPLPERLVAIYRETVRLLEQYQPDTAAVEKLFFQKNVRTAISVGQARGVVLLALAQAKVPIGNYTPMEIKQAVAGYGGADKLQVQHMVRALLNLEEIPRPDDAADALAVAITHLQISRFKSAYE